VGWFSMKNLEKGAVKNVAFAHEIQNLFEGNEKT
jgi:hypothetical protein